jgi:hypothetical protein
LTDHPFLGSSFQGWDGTNTYLRKTITNSGTMTIAGNGIDTRFYVNSADVILTGAGKLVLNPGNSAQRSRISSTNSNYVLTNDTNHTTWVPVTSGRATWGSSTGNHCGE